MDPKLKNYQKSFVLLSGGIDSTTCLAIANAFHDKHGGTVEAISIDYGQRHLKETICAAEICDRYGIKHQVLDCKGALGSSMLTDPNVKVPDISYDDITGISPTYVPFRNGFMLARLAAHAQLYVNTVDKIFAGWDPKPALDDLVTLYFGAHSEDAKNWAYPDCTPEFIGSMANAIYIGTYRSVRLLTPLAYLDKSQVVEWGSKLGAPYDISWSCYKGEVEHCGTCPTCRSRKDAFRIAGVLDPTKYAA
jgi:7-cyano-7-deazaguanine synthase